jgi:hypothetical protein
MPLIARTVIIKAVMIPARILSTLTTPREDIRVRFKVSSYHCYILTLDVGKDCGTVQPANVISTSYTSNEADLSAAYAIRQCNEYAKLGLMGVTFLFGSGDDGVAGVGGCFTANGNTEYIAYYHVPGLISSQAVKPLMAQFSTLASRLHARMSLRLVRPRLALANLSGTPKMLARKSYTLVVDSATISVCPTIRRLPSKGTLQLTRSHTPRIFTTPLGYVSEQFCQGIALMVFVVPCIP